MSFWKNLFGGGGQSTPVAPPSEEYKGFLIKATLMAAGGEHQLAGEIDKEIGGAVKTYKFVRADKFGSRDEAVQYTLAKGRQLIDEQGDKLFAGS